MAKEPNATTKETAAAKKKRKAASVKPRTAEEAGKQVLGTVAIVVQTQVVVSTPDPFNEIVIEWGCLGLSEEPDSVADVSANSRLADPKRPIITSDEGLHLFFDPPLSGAGTYGFQLLCTYNEAAEIRSSQPKPAEEKDDGLSIEQRQGARVTA